MSIYSNDNIRKITKLTTRELPHLVQKRENNCTRKIMAYTVLLSVNEHIMYVFLCHQNVKGCVVRDLTTMSRIICNKRHDSKFKNCNKSLKPAPYLVTFSTSTCHFGISFSRWRICLFCLLSNAANSVETRIVTFKRYLIIDYCYSIDDKSLPHKRRAFTRLLIFKIKFSSEPPSRWLAGSAEMTPVIGNARRVRREVTLTIELVD